MRIIWTSLLVVYAVDWLVGAIRVKHQEHRVRHARHNLNRRDSESYVNVGHTMDTKAPEERTIFERTTWTDEEYAGRVLDGAGHRATRNVVCYSCMSLAYQDTWDHLQTMYTLPHSFTNRCNDPFTSQGIGTINCTSICVTLMEPQVQGGVFIGYMFIRGCLDKVLRNGFNQSALRTHRFRHFDMCRNLPRAQLFNHAKNAKHHPYGEVQLCSCYGDRCNGAPANGRSSLAEGLARYLLFYMALAVIGYERDSFS